MREFEVERILISPFRELHFFKRVRNDHGLYIHVDHIEKTKKEVEMIHYRGVSLEYPLTLILLRF